jgi:uracil-DNA glycosylase
MTQVEDVGEREGRNSIDVQRRSTEVLTGLRADPNLGCFVHPTLGVPDVFGGKGEVRLIVLGQDPTVKNPRSLRTIKTVLNLDKSGNLRAYLSRICEGLGLNLDQHVYATNYLKNFFVKPPTQIDEIDVFQVFGPIWLPLLKDELAMFPQAPVVTLGQPLLGALVRPEASPLVRDYWGYTPRWKSGERGEFRHLAPQDNLLRRIVFPFPHQPSIRKQFYRERLADYTAFVREEAFPGSR